jgi:hypothetical protein
MASPKQMLQWAPWPTELEKAVAQFVYKPGWHFWLSDEPRDFADPERTVPIAGGLTFNFVIPCLNSYNENERRPVHHSHIVPAATYNRQSWEEWILQCIILSETHETCEWARFVSGDRTERRPFAPTHGPGDNPYVVRFPATDLQRRTSFRGVVNPER